MLPTDLTVSAVVRHDDDRYLIIEELSSGRRVLTQPGGHIDAGESPEQAIVRETLEETGCTVKPRELIGVYLWIHPQTRQQFLKLVYASDYVDCDESRSLDSGVIRRLWMTRDDLEHARHRLRTPVVLRCVHDFEQGKRQSDALLSGMLSLQNNVEAVLARADLV